MNIRTSLGGSVALAALLSASSAWADVTAAQIWQSWKDYYADMGQTVTAGSESMEGDTLFVRDVTFTSESPNAKSEGKIAEIALREVGDGTVEITMSEEIPVTLHATPAEGEPTDMTMTLRHSGTKIVASGTPEATTFDYTAPEMSLSMDEANIDGSNTPFKLLATVKGTTGSYLSEQADGRKVTSSFTSDSLDLAMTGADPESGGTFNVDGMMTGLTGNGSMTMPEGSSFVDMAAALKAGAALDGTFAYRDGTYTIDSTGADGDFKAESSGGAGNLSVKMTPDGLSYGGENAASKLVLSGSSLPFPIEGEVAQTAFSILVPVTKSDEAKPAGMTMKLVDLKVSDALWNTFDPAGQLPRDPATLIIDLSGAVKPLVDILDPAQTEAFVAPAEDPAAETPSPFEVSEAKINQLQIKAVGAELTGTGAFTFDNSAPTPMPIGTLDLSLTGANALMDKLAAMGLVPEDQLMGVRMMLGMFAVPAGEDALTSKIEFKEGGGIYANGQPLMP